MKREEQNVRSAEVQPEAVFRRLLRDFKAMPCLYRLSSPGELRGSKPLSIKQGCTPELFSCRPERRLRKHGDFYYSVLERFWLVFPDQLGKRTLHELELPPDIHGMLANGEKVDTPIGVFLWDLWRPGHGYYQYLDIQPPEEVAAFVHSFHDQGLNAQGNATRIEVTRFKNTSSFAEVLQQWVKAHSNLFS